MNCRQAERQILIERDGALDEGQRAALVAHIAECTRCNEMRSLLSTAVESLQQSGANVRIPDPELEWQKVRREIRNAPSKEHRSLFTWIAIPMAAAAALALGVYVMPTHPTETTAETGPIAIRESASGTVGGTPDASTVVFVDDKSGWTFVVAPETTG